MKKLIRRLRNRPEEERRHLLHLSIIILAIILIFFWVLSLGRNLANKNTKGEMKQNLQSFSDLKNNLVDQYKNISGQNSRDDNQ
jgi:uncharacterized protein (UPF0333 family)